MSKNNVPWRTSVDNSFTRDPKGGTSRQHPNLRKATADRMRAKKIDEAICRAFQKTGLLVTQENYASLPETHRAEWEQAIKQAEQEIAELLEGTQLVCESEPYCKCIAEPDEDSGSEFECNCVASDQQQSITQGRCANCEAPMVRIMCDSGERFTLPK